MLTASYQKENPLFGQRPTSAMSGINAACAERHVVRQHVSGEPVRPRYGRSSPCPAPTGTTINPAGAEQLRRPS